MKKNYYFLLKRFLEKHLSYLDESSLKALIEILDMEDNDLADLLIYKTETPKDAHRAIIKKILSD